MEKQIRIYGGHCCLILFFGGLTWVAGKIFEKQCRVSRVFLVPPFDGDTPTGPRRCVLKLFATEFEGKKHRDNKNRLSPFGEHLRHTSPGKRVDVGATCKSCESSFAQSVQDCWGRASSGSSLIWCVSFSVFFSAGLR